MNKLQQASAPNSEAFLADAGARLAALCTACGACYEACPMPSEAGLPAADPSAVTQGLRALALGSAAPAETIRWVGACCRSGVCVRACPEYGRGLDAMLLMRVAKRQALNTTGQLAAKGDAHAFPRVKAFARLQLTDEELEQWL